MNAALPQLRAGRIRLAFRPARELSGGDERRRRARSGEVERRDLPAFGRRVTQGLRALAAWGLPGASHASYDLEGLAAWCRRPANLNCQFFFNWPWGKFWDHEVVKNGFLAKFHAGLTYFQNFSMDF